MRSTLVFLGIASTAYAAPKKTVEVAITFHRHITDNSTDVDSGVPACVATTTFSQELDETVTINAGKMPMIDGGDRVSFSLPMPDAGSLASMGALTIAPQWPDAKATGQETNIDKAGNKAQADTSMAVAAQAASLVISAGGLDLQTTASRNPILKAAPQMVDQMKLMAQDKPLVVQTTGGAVDVGYTDEQTIDMAKLQPPSSSSIKRTATRKVVTEVSVHLTPSKP
jgi:hypothetical protein